MNFKTQNLVCLLVMTFACHLWAGPDTSLKSFSHLKSKIGQYVVTLINFESLYFKNDGHEGPPLCFTQVLKRNSLTRVDERASYLGRRKAVHLAMISTDSGPVDQLRSPFVKEIPDAGGIGATVHLIVQDNDKNHSITCAIAGEETKAEAESRVLEVVDEILEFPN